MKINYSTIADDKLASFRYRVQIPAKHMREWGHEVTIGEPEQADIGVFSKHFNTRDYEIARQPTRYRQVVFDVCDYHLDGPYRDHYERMINLADIITVGTVEMGLRIYEELGCDTKVIADPYEFDEKPPAFNDGSKVLWFGHPSNLKPLMKEFNSGTLQDHWLQVISQPNGLIPTVPWSIKAMEQGLEECDVVILPQEDTKKNRCKGANRMVEAIRSGRFVVANPMPAYEPFRKWMFLGDIKEGLEWTKQNKTEIADRIRQAQKYVTQEFSPTVISRQWLSAFMSAVAVTC